MAKNIKDITKELMGSSLNSFHQKTGLKQLENNNEAQTRVLDGIYSQVDNAYIEKTEQDKTIHLEGSDNGSVEMKLVEGNSKLNLVSHYVYMASRYYTTCFLKRDFIKPNTKYTAIITNLTDQILNLYWNEHTFNMTSIEVAARATIIVKNTTHSTFSRIDDALFKNNKDHPRALEYKVILLEGDDVILNQFDGIKSSFEEHATPDGKYKATITLKNKNLFNINEKDIYDVGTDYSIKENTLTLTPRQSASTWTSFNIKVRNLKRGGKYTLSAKCNYHLPNYRIALYEKSTNKYIGSNFNDVNGLTISDDVNVEDVYLRIHLSEGEGSVPQKVVISDIMIENNAKDINYAPQKQNKITILLEQPLRGLPQTKDRLCVIDEKLVVERNITKILVDSSMEVVSHASDGVLTNRFYLKVPTFKLKTNDGRTDCLCNIIPASQGSEDKVHIRTDGATPYSNLSFWLDKQSFPDPEAAKRWLIENNAEIIAQLSEPVYEEVTNEFGEPIILKGYENGTVYIDSLIPPTTTVRYTPKNQTFKALKNVNTANAELAFDINSNVLPYIMELDSMILEKELIQNYKMKMEALDMTSMQERTFNMLARLIRGKSLTKEEAKDRVLLYETANRITSKQALELMVIIEETYA